MMNGNNAPYSAGLFTKWGQSHQSAEFSVWRSTVSKVLTKLGRKVEFDAKSNALPTEKGPVDRLTLQIRAKTREFPRLQMWQKLSQKLSKMRQCSMTVSSI